MVRRQRWLEPGEVVLYAAPPHPVLLVRPLLEALAVLAACAYAFVAWSSAPSWFGAVLAAAVLADAGVLGGRLLRYRSALLMVTSTRIVHRQGFLHRVGRELPISKVEDVAYEQGLVGRMLGYGTVTVESAGSAPARPFDHVRDPEGVQHGIHRASEAASRRRQPPAPPAIPIAGGGT